MALVDHPDNPIPQGAATGFVTTPDKVKLRYAHWPSVQTFSKGTVTIFQGRAEFIEKYFDVVNDLRHRGFSVVAFDWRGQGGSQRSPEGTLRGHISDFKKYRQDLRTILKEVSLANYPGPHFALAHSTGCLVLLTDTLRLRTILDRAVLVSPLLGLPFAAWPDGLLKAYRMIVRTLTFGLRGHPPTRRDERRYSNGIERILFPVARLFSLIGLGRLYVPGGNSEIHGVFETNRQTSDRLRYDRFNEVLRQSPELGVGSATLGWLSAAGRAMTNLRRRDAGPGIKLPCLVLAAGDDRIVSTPTTEEFVSRTKAAGYLEIAGAQHEIMMERDVFRDKFWAAFDAFIPGTRDGGD